MSTQTVTVPSPASAKRSDADRSDLAYASQYRLIWHRFKKHKVAMGSLVVLILLYLGAIFAEFLAPYEKNYRIPNVQYSSPTRLRIFEPGKGLSRPFVYGMVKTLDNKTFTYKTIPDPTEQVLPPLLPLDQSVQAPGLYPAPPSAVRRGWRVHRPLWQQ